MKLFQFVRDLSAAQRFFACFIIIISLLTSIYYYLPLAPSLVNAAESTKTKQLSIPTFINIPSISLALPIVEVESDTNLWSKQPSSVSHLDISGLPGGSSNIILFGENHEDTLKPISSIKKGDKITLISRDGSTHTYIVSKLYATTPNDPDITSNLHGEKVTIFMPYGFLRTKRLVVVATPS